MVKHDNRIDGNEQVANGNSNALLGATTATTTTTTTMANDDNASRSTALAKQTVATLPGICCTCCLASYYSFCLSDGRRRITPINVVSVFVVVKFIFQDIHNVFLLANGN